MRCFFFLNIFLIFIDQRSDARRIKSPNASYRFRDFDYLPEEDMTTVSVYFKQNKPEFRCKSSNIIIIRRKFTMSQPLTTTFSKCIEFRSGKTVKCIFRIPIKVIRRKLKKHNRRTTRLLDQFSFFNTDCWLRRRIGFVIYQNNRRVTFFDSNPIY